MIVCGMTTGGFILEQIAGNNPNDWQKAMGVIGAIVSGNAQKTIFFDPLQELVDLCTTWLLTAEAKERFALIFFTFLSGACTFMINYGLSSFGAEIFMIAILGASGPPGWIALAFALFFALMNALLVLSGTLSSIQKLKPGESVIQIMAQQFLKRTVLTLCVAAVVIWGLVMTFYPGADEVAAKFGGYIVAGLLLLGAMWSEGYYAFKKIMDTWRAGWKNLPPLTFLGVWDKFCAVANAITVVFMGIEGGKRAADAMTISGGSDGHAAVQGLAGIGAGFISYAYTIEESSDDERTVKEKKSVAVASPIKTQFDLFIGKSAATTADTKNSNNNNDQMVCAF